MNKRKEKEDPKRRNASPAPIFHQELEKAYQEAAEVPLLEQVRRRRSDLSRKYNIQLEILNRLEQHLTEMNPEGVLADIRRELSELNYIEY